MHCKDGKALGSGTNGVGTGDIGTDLELVFIKCARTATLKIPSHQVFMSVLSAEQRPNLTAEVLPPLTPPSANGEDILHQLGHLKATLVDRYKHYAHSPSASADSVPAFTLTLTYGQAAAEGIDSKSLRRLRRVMLHRLPRRHTIQRAPAVADSGLLFFYGFVKKSRKTRHHMGPQPRHLPFP
ncbi:hypothetical protein B0H10DRAFT_2214545 [Mycena sp. CBHHK59/15]|nr:hypothetical protein B0H10DRAFT_2214545 [Mycena sp. CBHHK59/15]